MSHADPQAGRGWFWSAGGTDGVQGEVPKTPTRKVRTEERSPGRERKELRTLSDRPRNVRLSFYKKGDEQCHMLQKSHVRKDSKCHE